MPAYVYLLVTHDRNQGLQLLSLPNALLCLEDQCHSVGNAQNWSPDAVRVGRPGLTKPLTD